MFCYNEAPTRQSVAISGPRLGEGIGHLGAHDQVMVMAYRPQRNQTIIVVRAADDTMTSALGSIRRWWCSLAGVDSLFLYTDNDVLKIHIPVFHVPD
jgi:hypothetical protein